MHYEMDNLKAEVNVHTTTKIVIGVWAAVGILVVTWLTGLIAGILLLGTIYVALMLSAIYAVVAVFRYSKRRSERSRSE